MMDPERQPQRVPRGLPRAILFLPGGILLSILVSWVLLFVWPLPSPAAFPLAESTRILDRYGRPLYEIPVLDQGSHTHAPLAQISMALRQATIASEDASFYSNPGVDLAAVGRALVQNLAGRGVVSGGSTITQQLARELYFTAEERTSRSLIRKATESLLALWLTARLSKDEVLELYLNRVYYGHLAYGIESAARTYFGKSSGDLDLAEASLLGGLPQSPARYDPFSHWEAAKERQATVLSRMRGEGYISEEEAKAAMDEPLRLARAPFPIHAPHFVAYVLQWVEENQGLEALERGGLRIYTTLDLDMQLTAESMVLRRLSDLQEHDASNAALVALDVATGQVLAMVGSADYFDASIQGEVNMALAPRQPGSAIKPITYAQALSQGYTAATPILDVPTTLLTRRGQPYAPNNYDAIFHGPVSLRYALASSFNVPAVRVTSDIGVDSVLRLAWDLGITTLGDAGRYDLSLTLGGGEVSLLGLTGAYAAFASGGLVRGHVVVTRVEDAAGRVIYRWLAGPGRRAVSPQVAYLLTSILSDNQARAPAFGQESPLRLSRPAAAKTGTTSDFRDNWTIGYTPDMAVGVWVGNADNRSMRDVSGISGAAPLWHDFMEEMLKMMPSRDFPRPPGLVEETVCEPTGLKPGPWCAESRLELFIAGTEPAAVETYYRPVPVCLLTGQLSAPECPPQWVVEKVYAILPEEAVPWALAAGFPAPPQAPSPGRTGTSAPTDSDGAGAAPPLGRTGTSAPTGSDGAGAALAQASPLGRTGTSAPTSPGGALPAGGRDYRDLWVKLISPGREEVLAISQEIPRESQQLIVEAVAGGPSPLEKVEFYDRGILVGTRDGGPFRLPWRLAAGEHRFQAVAYDGQGRRSQSQETRITVLP